MKLQEAGRYVDSGITDTTPNAHAEFSVPMKESRVKKGRYHSHQGARTRDCMKMESAFPLKKDT